MHHTDEKAVSAVEGAGWHRGDWMQTYTGRKFYPYDPRVEDVDILDIAHALSMTCRYNGHCKQFYSVAQHSVLLAECATAPNALRALLHDAPEAYVGDMIRPIKHHPGMVSFLWVEEVVEKAVCARFNLPYPLVNSEIKRLDNAILLDEQAQVMIQTPHDWGVSGEPLGVEIERWSPETARWKFMNAFERYSRWSKQLELAV